MNCFQIHYSLYQISYTILNYCFYCKQDKSCFYRLYLTRATQFNYKLLTIFFHRFRNKNNNGINLSIQLQYIDFFYRSRYWCLCAALLLSVCCRFGRLYFMLKYLYPFVCSVVLIRYISQI